MKIALITLGCPKNLVDTEVMLGLLADAGHEFVGDPGEAEAVIVNTCSFISAAVQESREVVDGCMELKREGSVRHVVVTGCLPQRYGERTWRMFPGVDAVVGCSDFESIARVLDDVEGGLRPFVCREPTTLYDDTSPRVLGTPAHLAYVKIAEGCDNRCAYCTIPTLRGRLRSRALDSVVREVENLVAFGVREINLIAQDTTAYGTDIASDVALPALLSALDDTRAPWIRVLYTHPAHVGDELLSAIAELDSVVPYLDMPIQHIADAVLERMGRATDGDRIRSIVSRARELVPGIAIRSSVMTGFPGETETDFQELYEFIEAGNLDHLGVFEFSPEEGTRAHDLPDRVPASTASMRARTLIEAMEGVTERRGRELIGNDVVVLVDASEGDELEARTAGQAWEMDGIVQVDLAAVPGVSAALPTGETGVAGHCLRPGEFTTVTITGANGFDLVARPAAGAPGSDREGETA